MNFSLAIRLRLPFPHLDIDPDAPLSGIVAHVKPGSETGSTPAGFNLPPSPPLPGESKAKGFPEAQLNLQSNPNNTPL